MSLDNRTATTPFQDPLFKWFLAFATVVLLGFVAKETLHFSNAPSVITRDFVRKEALPGGSRVWLNTDTRFSYGTPWQGDIDRDLWVEGEGWFELRKWGSKGYVIHTPFADIMATNADFNVTNRNDKLCVYASTGRLILRPGPENKFREFFMNAGDYYEFDKGVVLKKSLPATETFPWHKDSATNNF